MRLAILQRHALAQLRRLLCRQHTENSRRILAFHLEARMHHGVGQLARGGEDQQTAGADIQTPDRQPARAAQRRQLGKHGFAALRVFARDDFAFRLVIDQHADRLRNLGDTHIAAIDLNFVGGTDARADGGHFAVDGHACRFDPRLHCSA